VAELVDGRRMGGAHGIVRLPNISFTDSADVLGDSPVISVPLVSAARPYRAHAASTRRCLKTIFDRETV